MKLSKLIKALLAITLTSSLCAETPHFKESNAHLLPNVVKGVVVSVEGRFDDLKGVRLETGGAKNMKEIAQVNKIFRTMVEVDPTITPFNVKEILVLRVLTKSGVTPLIVLIENEEEYKRVTLALKAILGVADQDGLPLGEVDLIVEGTCAGSTKDGIVTVLRGEIIIRTAPKVN